jgi:hypothetical protein
MNVNSLSNWSNVLAALIVVLIVANGLSRAQADELVRSGMNYSAARKLLLSKGYVPLKLSKQHCLDNASGRTAICETYTEMTFCAGTGLANCQFGFEDQHGGLVLVETEGEEQNVPGHDVGLDLGVKRTRAASPTERNRLLTDAQEQSAGPKTDATGEPRREDVTKLDVPVLVTASDGDACANGEIVGLDAKGDGFLSVRSGPGGRPYREIDRLINGNQVYLCGQKGLWHSVVYTADRSIGSKCGVSTPWATTQAYTGPCRSGWIYGRYVKATAG